MVLVMVTTSVVTLHVQLDHDKPNDHVGLAMVPTLVLAFLRQLEHDKARTM